MYALFQDGHKIFQADSSQECLSHVISIEGLKVTLYDFLRKGYIIKKIMGVVS